MTFSDLAFVESDSDRGRAKTSSVRAKLLQFKIHFKEINILF